MAADAPPPADRNGSTADAPGERAVRVRCPHCGNRIQLVEPEPREVVCQSCGSSFKLDPDATTTHRPADVPRTIGRFRVVERLGRGSFGAVYKAADPDLDRTVAVKVPRAGTFATADEEARFTREAKAAARLAHPGIVTVYEVATAAGAPVIVSEYIDGLTLADRLTGGRPSFRESAELVAAVADALDYAHRSGVVHRDVKPSNILLDRAGKPHLADFGLARRDEGEITVTLDGQVLGTPAYMSPEQARGDRAVDGRADVYALGVVLYELLAGELPFRGNTRMLLHQVLHDDPRSPRRLNDHIPRDLETIALKAMAKHPAGRYATAGELAADLRRWLDGRPVLARPVGRLAKGWRWAKRNPTVAGLTAAVVLILAWGATTATIFAVMWKGTADKLDDELRQAERRQGELAVEKGVMLCDRGEEKPGLLWLAQGLQQLENAGGHDTQANWSARMQLALWGQAVRPRLVRFERNCHGHGSFFSDGKTYVAWLEPPTEIGRFDVDTGKLLRTFPVPKEMRPRGNSLPSIEIAGDDRAIITGSFGGKEDDHRVSLLRWDVATGQMGPRIDTYGAYSIPSPTKNHVVGKDPTSKGAGKYLLWDLRSTRPAVELDLVVQPDKTDDEIWFHYFSRDGRYLLVKSSPTHIHVWDTEAGRRVSTIRIGNAAEITAPAVTTSPAVFSPDGTEVVTATRSGVVTRWDAQTGQRRGEIDLAGSKIGTLDFSGDGHWLIAYENRDVRFPSDRFESPGRVVRWPSGIPWPYAEIHPDTTTLDQRFGLKGGNQLFDLSSGRAVGRSWGSSERFLRYACDGRVILTTTGTLSKRCRDTMTGEALGPELDFHSFHSDENRLIGTDVMGWAKMVAAASKAGRDLPSLPLTHVRMARVEGSPEQIALWTQVLTGMELDESGEPRPLDAATLADRKRRLDELGGSPLPGRP